MRKNLLLIFLSLFSLSLLFFYQYSKYNDGKLHLIICDVGQGDGILIRTPKGNDIVVDGGPNDKILNCLSKHLPFWDRDIELMLMTHPDADHLTGLISVTQSYNILNFVTVNIPRETAVYKRFMDLLASNKIIPKYMFAGDNIDFGDGVTTTLFWPEEDFFIANAAFAEHSIGVNDFAIVQVLSYGNFKALLTADVGANILDQFAQDIGKVDVLKVPHHGSKTGMSDLFLTNIRPEIGVISVGASNRYGHPTQIMLDLLAKYNIEIFRTDKNGEVEVVSDGQRYNILSN